MKFKIVKLNVNPDYLEQLGTKEKFWFTYKGSKDRVLFKYSRENTGEHWSEKIAEQLCHELGIPHAPYEMAQISDRYGIVTPNIIPENCRMVMGNEVLHQDSPSNYPSPTQDQERIVRVRQHTVTRVLGVLDKGGYLLPESDYNLDGLTASDLFCGYLMLDTLISNQDRHHENWAIVVNNESGERYLCPTYDHAASLGRELTDERRRTRLQSKDEFQRVPYFITKARSEFFRIKADKKRLLTIDAFFHAVEKKETAKKHWITQLTNLSDDKIEKIFDNIPNTIISGEARQFAKQVVLENKKRLLGYEEK